MEYSPNNLLVFHPIHISYRLDHPFGTTPNSSASTPCDSDSARSAVSPPTTWGRCRSHNASRRTNGGRVSRWHLRGAMEFIDATSGLCSSNDAWETRCSACYYPNWIYRPSLVSIPPWWLVNVLKSNAHLLLRFILILGRNYHISSRFTEFVVRIVNLLVHSANIQIQDTKHKNRPPGSSTTQHSACMDQGLVLFPRIL